MSALAASCFELACDLCHHVFIDDDSESVVHGPSAEMLREWAGRQGWVILPKADFCQGCRLELAGQRHVFVAGVDGFCVYCREWADHELHPNAPLPGQLEIPLTADGANRT